MSDCWHTNHKCYSCGQVVLMIGLSDSIAGFCINNHCINRFRPYQYKVGESRNTLARIKRMSGMTAQILQGFEDYMSIKSGEIPF